MPLLPPHRRRNCTVNRGCKSAEWAAPFMGERDPISAEASCLGSSQTPRARRRLGHERAGFCRYPGPRSALCPAQPPGTESEIVRSCMYLRNLHQRCSNLDARAGDSDPAPRVGQPQDHLYFCSASLDVCSFFTLWARIPWPWYRVIVFVLDWLDWLVRATRSDPESTKRWKLARRAPITIARPGPYFVLSACPLEEIGRMISG